MTDEPTRSHPDLTDTADRARWLALLEERFGMPAAVFDDCVIFRRSRKYVSIAARDHRPPGHPAPETGLPFIRTNIRYPKLTTAAAQLFGRHAARNYVDVDRRQADAFLARASFAVSPGQARPCTGTGYVLVRHAEITLGMAFYRAGEAGGTLRSLFPKALARP